MFIRGIIISAVFFIGLTFQAQTATSTVFSSGPASPANAAASKYFHGFDFNGEVINPVCISKMQPWLSDTGIIIKSIVLEEC